MNKKQIQTEIDTITHITFDLEDRLRKLTERLIELKKKFQAIVVLGKNDISLGLQFISLEILE